MSSLFSKDKRLRNDFLLAALILLISLLIIFIGSRTKDKGKVVCVSVDGEITAEYSLEKNMKRTIITNSGSNTLEIRNGKAYLTVADCPDKICVRHPAISKSGESIICLPHRLVISIR